MEKIKNWLNGEVKRSTTIIWVIATGVFGAIVSTIAVGIALFGWLDTVQTTITDQYNRLHKQLMNWFNRI